MALFFHTNGEITHSTWFNPPLPDSPCLFVVLFSKQIDQSQCSAEFFFEKMTLIGELVDFDLDRIIIYNTTCNALDHLFS